MKKTKKDSLLNCCECCKQVPKSAALSFEGKEYILYFCDAECYKQWRLKTDQWLNENPSSDSSSEGGSNTLINKT